MNTKINVGSMFDENITSNIRDLVAQSSEFKTKVYKAMLMNNDISSIIIKQYMGYIDGFITSWQSYAESLSEMMKKRKGEMGKYRVHVSYDYIKDYIYSSYDFPSILQFTDGVLKGISSGKFTETSDVNEFREYTASKALHVDDPSVASVLQDVMVDTYNDSNFTSVEVNAESVAKYNIVRTYKMFNKNDGICLYKAIDKTIQYITSNNRIEKCVGRSNMQMFIAAINNILDYITLTLTVFACRIYIIDRYASCFYQNSASGSNINESVDTDSVKNSPSAESSHNIESRIMIELDDTIARDINRIKEFFDEFARFIRTTGVNTGGKNIDYNRGYDHYETTTPNRFVDKLSSNAMYVYAKSLNTNISNIYGERIDTRYTESKATELNHSLRSFMYNDLQGIAGTSTPKNEFLHVIRGTEPESRTMNGYKDLSLELYELAISFLQKISLLYDQISRWKTVESREPTTPIATFNVYTECSKMLTELYRDVAMAVLQKARDIETMMNILSHAQADKTMIGLKLNLPIPSPDEVTDSNMTAVVPDTTRMPIDLMDLYSLPAFEAYEMYDEYLRTLPEFKDYMYLREDLDMSGIVNNIIAAFQGIFNYLARFFQNKSVQSAFNYVQSHKQELLNMTFDGSAGMEVAPYLENVNIATAKMFTTGLNKFKADTDLADETAMKKFIATLYPDENTYNMFNGEKADKKNAPILYKNLVLFGKAELEIPSKKLTNNTEIKKELRNWVGTLEQGNNLFTEIKKMIDDMKNVMNSFKIKLPAVASSSVNNLKTQANKQTPPKINNTNDNSNTNSSTTSSNSTSTTGSSTEQNTEPINDKAQLATRLINEIHQAQINLIVPLQGIIIQIIKDEYKYIQEAYSIGSKSNQAQATQNSQQVSNNQ